jgi:hypothetical protein
MDAVSASEADVALACEKGFSYLDYLVSSEFLLSTPLAFAKSIYRVVMLGAEEKMCELVAGWVVAAMANI